MFPTDVGYLFSNQTNAHVAITDMWSCDDTWRIMVHLKGQPLVVKDTDLSFLADSSSCALTTWPAVRRLSWLVSLLSPYTVIHSHHWTTESVALDSHAFLCSDWRKCSEGGQNVNFRTFLACDWLCMIHRNRRTGTVLMKYINRLTVPLNIIDVKCSGIDKIHGISLNWSFNSGEW